MKTTKHKVCCNSHKVKPSDLVALCEVCGGVYRCEELTADLDIKILDQLIWWKFWK